jgi:hypothetical protein
MEIEAIGAVASGEPGELRLPERNSGGRRAESPRAPSPPPPPMPLGDVGLVFEVGGDVKDLIIKIVDRESQQVIRQIPPEEMQRIRAAMENMVGLLLDRTG